MTENEKIAALAAALDGMKAERNWYRTAWTEAFRERDRLETELEHANNSLAFVRKERDELSNALSQARDRIFSLEYSRNKAQRQLEELREWAAVASEDLRLVREERDELRNWYQSVMEQAEEFGL